MTRFAEAEVAIIAGIDDGSFGAVKGKINSMFGRAGGDASRAFTSGFDVRGLAMKLGGMMAGWAVLKNSLIQAANTEQLETSFKVLLSDAKAAKELMKDIALFAAETPFELNELANASKQLLAFGVAGKDIIKTLRMLGDISAGLGIPLGDLAYLFGTTKTQGRLFAQDMNQFVGRGVPLIQSLAKQFGVAESEVKKLVEQGKVGFPQVLAALEELTGKGGKFEGMMAEQSKTLAGMWSTLKDNINAALRSVGQTLVEEFNLKGILSDANSLQDIFMVLADLTWSLGVAAKAWLVGVTEGVASLYEGLNAIIGKGDDVAAQARKNADAATEAWEKSWAAGRPSLRKGAFGPASPSGGGAAGGSSGGGSSGGAPAGSAAAGAAAAPGSAAAGAGAAAGSAGGGGGATGYRDATDHELEGIQELEKEYENAQKLLGKLRDELYQVRSGASAAEMELRKMLEAPGVDMPQIQKIGSLIDQINQQKKTGKLQQAGAALAEEVATPLEKFGARINELKEMLDVGAIDEQLFRRGTEKAEADAREAMGWTPPEQEQGRSSGARLMGLTEYANSLQEAIASGGKRDKTVDAMEKNSRILRQIYEVLSGDNRNRGGGAAVARAG